MQKFIVQHLINGVSKVVCAAAHPPLTPEVINVERIDCVKFGLIHDSTNLLVLPDNIKKLMGRHLNLRKHLYLDTTQTYCEMIINSTCCRVLARNYMMKLREEK